MGGRGASSSGGGIPKGATVAQRTAIASRVERAKEIGLEGLQFKNTNDGTGNIAFSYKTKSLGTRYGAIDPNGTFFNTNAYKEIMR